MLTYADAGLAPSMLLLLLKQQYVGDVTIVPPLTIESYSQVVVVKLVVKLVVKIRRRRYHCAASHHKELRSQALLYLC